MKTLMLMAKTPGQLCAMAMRSRNSSFPDHFALLHHLRLDDWDHRIATPEGEGANLEECLETLPVKFHTLLLDV